MKLASLIRRVEQRRRSLKMSQKDLADHCGLTQGHLSRILRGDLVPGRKTEEALRVWASSIEPGDRRDEAELRRLIARLSKASPSKRSLVLSVLRSLDALVKV